MDKKVLEDTLWGEKKKKKTLNKQKLNIVHTDGTVLAVFPLGWLLGEKHTSQPTFFMYGLTSVQLEF